MDRRSFGSGRALSSQGAKSFILGGLFALAGCGTAAQAPSSDSENAAATSAELTITDPSTPLSVTLPQAADPLTNGLAVPADAAQKGMWSSTFSWPLNGLHSVL